MREVYIGVSFLTAIIHLADLNSTIKYFSVYAFVAALVLMAVADGEECKDSSMEDSSSTAESSSAADSSLAEGPSSTSESFSAGEPFSTPDSPEGKGKGVVVGGAVLPRIV